MDLHGENSFKAKSYSNAAFKIERFDQPLQQMNPADIYKIQRVGESLGKAIIELLGTGKIASLEELLQRTPPGVLEIMQIKGLGPKKVSVIWKEMEIEDIGELLYACHENRLLLYKGFGKATQASVIEAIDFYQKRQGTYLYAQVELLAAQMEMRLKEALGTQHVYITGDFRRQEETIEMLEYVVGKSAKHIKEALEKQTQFVDIEQSEDHLLYKYDGMIRVKLFPAEEDKIEERLFLTTGSNVFIDEMKRLFPEALSKKNEEGIFKNSSLQYIPPCARESADVIDKAKRKEIPQLITTDDVKAIIHSHSTWSDGVSTIEEMALAAQKIGLEYLVISDHSKSAFYANGLTEERIKAQHQEIEALNKKYAPFKIFKSIESDILSDGSLDYSDSFLSTFDLVIASVHSNLKMDEQKAMKRLLTAIENPYTTILGHMTGRLLLSRPGYKVDYKKIVDACAANHVVIELNAHPKRLDIRWQWISYALEKNVLISIDPDAHSIPEFENIKYGVLAAQKALVTKENNLSSFNLVQFEDYIEGLRSKKKVWLCGR